MGLLSSLVVSTLQQRTLHEDNCKSIPGKCQNCTHTHTHARTHATRFSARTHAHTHTHTVIHTHTHTHTHTHLDLNVGKTKEIVIDFTHFRKSSAVVPDLFINGVTFERVTEYKYVLDCKLPHAMIYPASSFFTSVRHRYRNSRKKEKKSDR